MALSATSYKVRHVYGLSSAYSAFTSEEKAQIIYFCTDTEGEYKGTIIYNDIEYGSATEIPEVATISSVSIEVSADGATLTITESDGSSQTATMAGATDEVAGLLTPEYKASIDALAEYAVWYESE